MYKAFTLAELLIIIWIFGIIVVMTLPSILSKCNKDWAIQPNVNKIKIDKSIDYDFTK